MKARQLVWFRSDLRVTDNPALDAAMDAGETVAVFLVAAAQWRSHGVGDNRLAFLLRCLDVLRRELQSIGVPLKIRDAARFDDAPARIDVLMDEIGCETLHFNAEYPIDEHRRDREVVARVEREGRRVQVHHGHVLAPPGSVVTASGTPYTVFTPFKRRLREQLPPDAVKPAARPRRQSRSRIEADDIPRTIDGVDAQRLADLWPGGSAEAEARLERFLEESITSYADHRNRPDLEGTSRLSAYLAVGAISIRTCLAAARECHQSTAWEDELIWREFYQHVIAAFRHVNRGKAFRQEYDAIRWRDDEKGLAAWKDGRTGYPLVDAGMRQLAATGWMHNRLRMVTAMFLTKHLLIDWREGERHFMDLLVDGDFAANNGGWQWSASTGTDAAPYFRIFNPIAQAKKCDPKGAFVRRWVPELSELDGKQIFAPWQSPSLAPHYPAPIVDHAQARERAIAAFKSVKH